MTGGGNVTNGPKEHFNFGLTLNCDPTDGPNNLQINFGKREHLHLIAVDAAICYDDPAITDGSPTAGFDTIEGSGLALLNGSVEALIEFRITDVGKPGRGADTVDFIITADGNTWELTGSLTGGNVEAHPAPSGKSAKPTSQRTNRPGGPTR